MDAFLKLSEFLANLDAYKLHYNLEHNREDAIMVIVATPTERWEINFFANGAVEVERFKSMGFSEEEDLESLFAS